MYIGVSVPVYHSENLLKEPMGMCLCLHMYMAVAQSDRISQNECVCGWVCMRACACVTYVCVYPCMCCLRKYKTQKGFRCNVHLSVSVHQVKVPAGVVNY